MSVLPERQRAALVGCLHCCMLLTWMLQIVSHDIGRGFLYAEGEDGRRMGEDEVVTQDNCVMRFAFTRAVRPQNHTGSTGAGAGAGAGAGGTGAEGDGAGSKQRQKK